MAGVRAIVVWLAAAGVLYGWACRVHAQGQAGVFVALAAPKQLRVDGDLGEWRRQHFQSIGDAANSSADVSLAYDVTGLYVAARVHDDSLVRTAQPSPREDALVVTLAFAEAGHWTARELWLYAGVVGRSAAVLALQRAGGATQEPLHKPASIVEGPLDGGYALEAFIPWASLGHGAHWQFARGAVRLHDVDRAGAAAHERSSSSAHAAGELPWLIFDGGPVQALSGLLREKNLGATTPKLDWVGELRADGKAVRVLVLGTFVVLSDQAGRFTFEDLPASSSADVLDAQLRDLTGDERPELVLRLRQQNELGSRELLRVLDLQPAHATPIFGIETRKQTPQGFVDAKLEIRAGRPPVISVRSGQSKGLSEQNYQETPATGIEAMLLPWGPIAERDYSWNGSRFAVLRELPNPHAQPAAAKPETAAPAASVAPVAQLAAPAPAGVSAVLDAYRQARGVPAGAHPSFSLQANVAQDARAESVLVFGNEVVVAGEGFREGTSFFYFALPVRDPADVLQLFGGDVTGDGRSELFVRLRQHLGEVTRELLFGYTFVADALQPIVSIEVARAHARDSIVNVPALVREGRHSALLVKPGTATGWTAASYPYLSGSQDGVGPLLLPWQDGDMRYRFDGQKLVGAPAH